MRHDPPRPTPIVATRVALALVALALSTSCTTLLGDAAEPWRQNAELVIHTTLSAGARDWDADPEHVEDTTTVVGGLEVDWYDPRAILGYEVGAMVSSDDDVDHQEGFAGVRRTWPRDGWTPFVGAGVSFVNTEPEGFTEFDSWGGYAHAGVHWPLAATLFSFGAPTTVGIDLRTVVGDHVSSNEVRVFVGFGSP